MDLKITPSGQTIVKPTALGPVANTDTKLLIYGLFQKGRVLAQDELGVSLFIRPVCQTPAQFDSNGTARVGGGRRGVTEIVRSLESIQVRGGRHGRMTFRGVLTRDTAVPLAGPTEIL